MGILMIKLVMNILCDIISSPCVGNSSLLILFLLHLQSLIIVNCKRFQGWPKWLMQRIFRTNGWKVAERTEISQLFYAKFQKKSIFKEIDSLVLLNRALNKKWHQITFNKVCTYGVGQLSLRTFHHALELYSNT